MSVYGRGREKAYRRERERSRAEEEEETSLSLSLFLSAITVRRREEEGGKRRARREGGKTLGIPRMFSNLLLPLSPPLPPFPSGATSLSAWLPPPLPPVVVVHYARRKGRRRGKNGKRKKKMEKEVPVSLCSVGKEEERQVAPAYLLECLAPNERRGRVR